MSGLDRGNAAMVRGQVDRATRKCTVTLNLKNAEPVTLEGREFFTACGSALVVHRVPWAKTWQVTEPVTGLLIGCGYRTRDAAMIDAQQRANRRPGAIAAAVEYHGKVKP